jgi:hypothetical protein
MKEECPRFLFSHPGRLAAGTGGRHNVVDIEETSS